MKKLILIISSILLFTCTTVVPRMYIYKPNNDINVDSEFEKKCESYGAYYIKKFLLVEYTKYRNNQLVTFFTYHHRIKILNKTGYEYAKISLPKSRQLIDFKIKVENKNGTIKEIPVDDLILIENESNNITLDNGYYIYSAKNIEPGSIIDFIAVIRVPFPLISERINILPDLPVYETDINIAAVSQWETMINVYNGLPKPVVKQEVDNKVLYSWYLDKLFPQHYEPYQEPVSRYSPYFTVSLKKLTGSTFSINLINDWVDIRNSYLKNSENKHLFTNKFKDELEIIKNNKKYGNSNPETIYRYIQDNFDFGFYGHPDDVLSEKSGSIYGLSLLTYILLDEAGHNPSYLVLKSFKNGDIDLDSPSLSEYDLIVPVVNDIPLFVFNKSYSFGQIPYYYEGTKAIQLLKESIREVDIIDSELSKNIFSTKYDIIIDTAIVINQLDEFKGHPSYINKENLDNPDSSHLNKKFVEDLFNERNISYKLIKHSIKNIDNANKNLKIYSKIKYPNLINNIDNDKIINLNQLINLNLNDLVNIEDRKNNFYFFYPHMHIFETKIHFEKKYHLNYSEFEDFSVDNKYFKQDLSITKNGNSVHINFKLGIKKKIIPRTEKKLVTEFVSNLNKVKSIKLLLNKK